MIEHAARWAIDGAAGLPIYGDTFVGADRPSATVLLVHGWTGCKDRNIVPAMTRGLVEAGMIVHRFTLSHAGIERDEDRITKPDEFERDSLAYCLADIESVWSEVHAGTLIGRTFPMVLMGHSRGGATVLGCAARHARGEWGGSNTKIHSVVSIAGTATYTRMTDEMRTELERTGSVTKPCSRAPGGAVRMGPSWYEHHFAAGGADFDADMADVRVPVLIVHGDADTSVPYEHAERTRALLRLGDCPRVRVERVPDADHNLNAGGFGFDRENISTPQTRAAVAAVLAFLGSESGELG